MPPIIASLLYAIGILALFYLDRDRRPRMSKALWIPAAWMFLISSRPVSLWLGISPNFSATDATAVYVEGSPVDRKIFLILLFAAIAVLASRSGRIKPLLQKNGVIFLYFAFCAISIIWSDFSFVALKRWTKALGEFCVVLVLLTERNPLVSLKWLLTRLGFLLFPLSILFIKYYPTIGRRLTMSWTEEATGVCTQKNELGLNCMLYGVFFLWMFVSANRGRKGRSRRHHMLAYGSIIAMIAWLLYQCNSTTSITGLICAGAIMWYASRPSHISSVQHMLVVAVLSLVTATLFFNPGGHLVQALGKDPTLTGRTQIWKMVLDTHTNPWIGTGFESFWLGPRLNQMRHALPNFPINEAHDGYLEVYLNLGWAGICLIAVLLITAYKRVSVGIDRDPVNGSLFLGFFLCTLFYSFTEAGFRLMSPSWFFLLLVIVASAQIVTVRIRVPVAVSRRGGPEAKQEIEYLVPSRSSSLDSAPNVESSNQSVADLSSLTSNK